MVTDVVWPLNLHISCTLNGTEAFVTKVHQFVVQINEQINNSGTELWYSMCFTFQCSGMLYLLAGHRWEFAAEVTSCKLWKHQEQARVGVKLSQYICGKIKTVGQRSHLWRKNKLIINWNETAAVSSTVVYTILIHVYTILIHVYTIQFRDEDSAFVQACCSRLSDIYFSNYFVIIFQLSWGSEMGAQDTEYCRRYTTSGRDLLILQLPATTMYVNWCKNFYLGQLWENKAIFSAYHLRSHTISKTGGIYGQLCNKAIPLVVVTKTTKCQDYFVVYFTWAHFLCVWKRSNYLFFSF